MYRRFLLAAGLIAGLEMTQAYAQAGSGASAPATPPPAAPGTTTAVTRVPSLGDEGNVQPPRRVFRRRVRASHPVLPPQNGSQPDRAGAGAGGR